MIDQLKKNVDSEIEILSEIAQYSNMMQTAIPAEKRLLATSLTSLGSSLKILNSSIPQMLSTISLAKKLEAKATELPLEKVNYKSQHAEREVVLNKGDKGRFFKELSISEDSLKKIKKVMRKPAEEAEEFKGSRGYLKVSNRLFMNTASDLIRKGRFKALAIDIQKANLDILLESYVAMIFFSTLLAFFGAIVLVIALVFTMPNEAGILVNIARFIWLIPAVPVVTFVLLYYYPASERGSLEKKIDQELPFAVIHMSAISGSGIEPSNIFKIIATNKEYPYLRKEIRKVINQINLYGYDLVTALNTVSRTTPSTRLAELFSGLVTTITSGGDLSEFFSKRAETLLVTYRLEREKFTKVAETFMDIYITVAIAAPMILLLILIILSLSKFSTGLSPPFITFIIIIGLGLINTAFLSILHLKQPKY